MSFVLQTKGNIMKLYSEVGRRFLEVFGGRLEGGWKCLVFKPFLHFLITSAALLQTIYFFEY